MSVDNDETWWSQFRRRVASAAGLKPKAGDAAPGIDAAAQTEQTPDSAHKAQPERYPTAAETAFSVPTASDAAEPSPTSQPVAEDSKASARSAEVGHAGGAIPQWHVFGASVRGASHERSGLPNQDAIRWSPESGQALAIVLTVADGHGSSRSFRSDQGAQFAVRAAVETLERLIAGQPDLPNHSATKRMAQEALPQDLVRTWDGYVDAALVERPLSEAELGNLEAASGPSARQAVEANRRLAYGATSVSVLITNSFILYVQLGDGDILAVSETGEVERPAPRDPRLFANETTSLCSDQAWRNVQVSFQTLAGSPPALIMLSTDGYANSFQNDDEFRRVGPDILSLLQSEGSTAVSESLGTWLNEASQSGSGDDITVGVAYRAEALNAATAGASSTESETVLENSVPSRLQKGDDTPPNGTAEN